MDVRRAKIFDRCAPKDGIVPLDALIEQFMTAEPYRSSPRVFVIVDNGSAHREKRSIDSSATTVRGTEPSPG
jgi:hypothetical protein